MFTVVPRPTKRNPASRRLATSHLAMSTVDPCAATSARPKNPETRSTSRMSASCAVNVERPATRIPSLWTRRITNRSSVVMASSRTENARPIWSSLVLVSTSVTRRSSKVDSDAESMTASSEER